MSAPSPTELIDAARSLIEADPDGKGFVDRCSVINRTYGPDGSGGTSVTETVAESDVPCKFNQRVYNSAQVAGGPLSHVTLKLYLIRSAATDAITPDDKIVVAARDDYPERTFEQLVRLDSTWSPVVKLAAMLKL